ncbi:hypothetical protein EB796_020902 [Bugula neritina]|uniref:VWFA domain-containing protein n=1 Tax=Bugula neritina TaxID=10212 RepID=A0A7J7J516_BUGNE|nr:hypothetical protein EB796_020902 [Bugula neritina]
MTGAPCKMDPVTSLPEPDCRYYPDRRQTKASSSLMYYHFLPSISTFCDDDEFGIDSVHNYEAPSQHNRLCAGKSAWGVMRDHVDFNGQNPAVDGKTINTSVTFNVVQRQESRVVLVIDVSGSMEDNNYYIKVNAAARRYLLYTAPDGASVGLVKYSSAATTLTKSLRKINSLADRKDLANLVPLEKKGGTAIGRGLLAAKQLLEQNGGQTKGSRVVLLTDGEETIDPKVKVVKPKLLTAGINVDTVLLSNKADPVLISLAASTGGLSFFASGDDLSTSLDDAFTTSERARISDPRKVPITIESRAVAVDKKSEECYDVIIDKSLGLQTTFTFSWVIGSQLNIRLTESDGKVNTAVLENANKAAAFRCSGECSTGKWTVCIKNPTNKIVDVISQVESTARVVNTPTQDSSSSANSDDEDMLPITVRTLIVNEEPDFNTQDAKPVSVFATVNRGYSPVIGAKVVATIEYPGSYSKSELEMRDDGAGADIVKGDGTYSAYIMNSQTKGRHTISVNVVNTNDTNVKKVTVYSSAGAISVKKLLTVEPGEPVNSQAVKLIPTDEFQRFSLAGLIDVKSVAPPNKDFHAPSRILDLEVTEASYDGSRVTLEWTAVGDDLDSGTASYYELWKADSHKVFYKAKENATRVEDADIISGNLSSPSPAYTREKLVLNIQDRDDISVYAIIAKDDAGNAGQLSNIVSVKLVYVPPTTQPPTKQNSSNIGLIVGIVLGSVGGVIIIVTLIYCARKKGVGCFKSVGKKNLPA